MADKIAANLVINTSLRAPRGTGLGRVRTELESIKSLMADINSQALVVDVRLRGSQQAMSALNQISMVAQNQLNRQQAAQARRAANPANAGGGNTPPVSSGNRGNNPPPPNTPQNTPPVPPRNRVRPGPTTDSSILRFESGDMEVKNKSQRRQGTIGTSTESTYRTDENGILQPFSVKDNTSDDLAKLNLNREKTMALRPHTNAFRDQDQQEVHAQRMAALQYHAQNARTSGAQANMIVGKTVPTKSGLGTIEHEELEIVRTLANGREEFQRYSTTTGELSKVQTRQTDSSKALDREQRRQAKILQNTSNLDENKKRGDREALKYQRRGFTELPSEIERMPADPNNPSGPERTSSKRVFERIVGNRVETVKYSEALGKATESTKLSTSAQRDLARAEAENRRQARLAQHTANLDENKRRGDSMATTLGAQGFTEGPIKTDRTPTDPNNPNGPERVTNRRTFERTIGDVTEVHVYDEALGKVSETSKATASSLRDIARSEREAAQVRKIAEGQAQAQIHHNNLLAEGYTVTNTAVKELTVGQQRLNVTNREYTRSSGNPILGNLAVDVAKVDSATGSMTRTTLEGSHAMRKLGDSFSNAVAKISSWFAATTAIFLFARGAQEAVRQFSELEAGTVFLARVGGELGSSWEKRLAEAKLLTTGIAELSAITGVSATEAQKAASISLRAGQDRIQTLASTKTAMLAASIAEMDVVEANKLLSSAQKQFNIEGTKSIYVLDTLNSLSNHYAVSTNDLLQSISRGGKIYATSGGQLEGLAATTAILADQTRRSGAEIGNALKTIQTRLTSTDVSKVLGEKLGLSLYDEATGKAKNFGTVLLQLQAAMVGLSDKEREQIGVTIAGSRQYNLLKNALDSVADIAIAEAIALRDVGSASEEAQQHANTLAAAIGRLQGEFSVMIDSSGKSAGSVLSSFVNLLSIILRLANAFDGLGVKLAVSVLAMGSIFLVVSRYGSSIAGAVLGTLRFAGSLGTLAGAVTGANVSLLTLLQTARLLQTAFISIGIGAALYAIFYAVDALTSALVNAEIAANAMSEAGDRDIETLKRQKTATLGLSEVLKQKLETQRKLNAMGKDAPEKDVKKNKEDISKLTTSLFGRDFGVGPLQKDKYLNDLDVMRIAEKNRHIKNLKAAYTGQVETEREGLKKVEDAKKEKYGSETSEGVKKRLKELEKKPKEPLTPQGYEVRGQEITRAQAKLAELLKIEGDIAKTKVKIKELQAKEYEADNVPLESTFNGKQKKSWDAAQDSLKRIEARKNERSLGIPNGGLPESNDTIESLVELRKEQELLIASFEDMPKGSEQYEELSKDIIKATEDLEKFSAQAYKAAYNLAKLQQTRVLTPINDIDRELFASDAKLEFARSEGKGRGGSKFEQFNSINADIEANKALAKRSAGSLAELTDTDPFGKLAGDSVSNLSAQEVHREAIAKALEAARQGEANAAKELLKIELDITKERVQQNKEAAKAAGLLSDEDKVKLLSQAQYFKDNPDKKINAQEAFFADAETNRLGQQFFGSRYDFNQDDKLGGTNKGFQNMMGPNFGMSKELVDAEEELKKHGLGPGATDEERRKFADKYKENIEQSSKDQASLTGETMYEEHASINVNSVFLAQDMKSLVDAFDGAVNTELLKTRDEIIKYIKDVWRPVKDAGIDRTGQLPPTSN